MFGISWPEMHGALTHFPVALLITAAVFEIAAAVLRKPAGRIVSLWLLVAAVVMAVPTLLTGWFTGNHIFGARRAPSVFVWHRAAAFTTVGLAVVLLLMRLRKKDQMTGGALAVSLFLILSIAGVVGFTGYLGGKMVFASQAQALEQRHSESPNPLATARKQPIDTQLIAAGQKLFRGNNCISCHKLNGQGGTMGPELTHEGPRHPDMAWQTAHLRQPDKMTPGSLMPGFAKLKPDELKALASFLISRQ